MSKGRVFVLSRLRRVVGLCVVVLLAKASTLEAQLPGPNPNPAEPDFTVISLPTTGQMPRHKFAFRLTHRFSRPLDGFGSDFDFGELVDNLFGFDSAAQIGLELRYGLIEGTQVGIHRTNDKTIQFFGQHGLLSQGDGSPVALDALLTVEGLDNFRQDYTVGVGAVVSRNMARRLAVYIEPIWVANTDPLSSELTDENHTFQVALASRLRVTPSVYLVGEFVPRAAGHTPGGNYGSFGIEKRAGGHLFQLNVSNGLGTTVGQLARGSRGRDDWFIGFNLSRKFF
jgi:hypothetical protein